MLCTVCCNCSKDTQSHCCCGPLVPPPPACAASCRRRTLWQCLCVECCKRASWSPHLAPKSFDEKKNSEPQPALVIKAPLLLFKSALESQIVDHSNSLCLVSRRVLTEKNTTKWKNQCLLLLWIFSVQWSADYSSVPSSNSYVTNPGFRTMYYYSTQVNKYAFNCTTPHGMAFLHDA